MPKLNAILETALYVDDLERAKAFYRSVLNLPLLLENRRMCAFDISGHGVLLVFRRGGSNEIMTTPGGQIPPHDGSGPLHMAFAISQDEFAPWQDTLQSHNIPIEAITDWPRGGRSLYFRDPDGHLLELATPGLWKTY